MPLKGLFMPLHFYYLYEFFQVQLIRNLIFFQLPFYIFPYLCLFRPTVST